MQPGLLIALLFFVNIALGQEKTPWLFRWQQKKVTQQIHRYLKHDTLIATGTTTIHLYYSDKRSKPYLLLLHGMGVDGKSNWYKQIPYLSRYYNLLIPDLVYYGSSRASIEDYSPEFQATQIQTALVAIKIPAKINVMGFSYGALVAALYNQQFASEVNKLILIDGPVKFYSSKRADSIAAKYGATSVAGIIIPQTLSDFSAMQKAVLSRWMPVSKKLKRKFITHYFTPTREVRLHQLNYLTANEDKYQHYDYNLDKTPTLLMWGGKDGVVPPAVGEKIHAAYPSTTEFIVFKKAKHDAHFRYSRELNHRVAEFIGR